MIMPLDEQTDIPAAGYAQMLNIFLSLMQQTSRAASNPGGTLLRQDIDCQKLLAVCN